MNPVKEFIKDLTMGTVGLIDIALGLVVLLSPSLPFIKVLGIVIAVGGATLILVGRG